MDKLDLNNITKSSYQIGILTLEVIEVLGLSLKETKIVIGKDKLKYTEKHKHKYKSHNEYLKHIELTPDIIANPDYVALHPTGKSIEYIKRIDEVMLVAVRVKPHGNLWVKSVFPISEAKLSVYLKSGTLKKLPR